MTSDASIHPVSSCVATYLAFFSPEFVSYLIFKVSLKKLVPRYARAWRGVSEAPGSSTHQKSWFWSPCWGTIGEGRWLCSPSCLSPSHCLHVNQINTYFLSKDLLFQTDRKSLRDRPCFVLQSPEKEIWVYSTTVGWILWYSSAGLLSFYLWALSWPGFVFTPAVQAFLWDTLPPCGIKL